MTNPTLKRLLPLAMAGAAAVALSACSSLLPPQHLTSQDVSGLTASQLSTARKYQQQIPAAESRVDAATRRYETAQARYTVAQRYARWQQLAQEVAVKRRDLAQAHVDLLHRQVQLARAQALANNSSPKQAQQLHVDRYQKRVNEQQAQIKDLQHTLGQLRSMSASAKARFETARNNLGSGQLPSPGPSQSSGKPAAPAQPAHKGSGLVTQPLQSSD